MVSSSEMHAGEEREKLCQRERERQKTVCSQFWGGQVASGVIPEERGLIPSLREKALQYNFVPSEITIVLGTAEDCTGDSQREEDSNGQPYTIDRPKRSIDKTETSIDRTKTTIDGTKIQVSVFVTSTIIKRCSQP